MSGPAAVNDLAALALICAPLAYVAACAFWPFKACRRCHGTGALRNPIFGGVRLCPSCDASGLRLRLGRRIFDAYRRHGRRDDRDLHNR